MHIKNFNANIYRCKQFYISYKTHGLYCHDFTFCKWPNLKKPRRQYDSQDEKLRLNLQARQQEFFGAQKISWKRGTSINSSHATYRRRAPRGGIFAFFLQNAREFNLQMQTNRTFFPKISVLFVYFKKTGETTNLPSWQLHA